MADFDHHRQGLYEPLISLVKDISPEAGNRIADSARAESGHIEVVTPEDALAIELASRGTVEMEEVLAYGLTLEQTTHLAGIRLYAEFGQAEAEAGGLPHFCPLDIEHQLKELDLWPEGV